MSRRRAVSCIAIAACAAPLAFAAQRGAEPGGGPRGLDVEVVSTSQAEILDKGRVLISISSRADSIRAELKLRSKTTNGRGDKLAKKRTVRTTTEPRLVRVRLGDGSLRRLAKCRQRKLIVSGFGLFEGDIAVGDTDRVEMTIDTPACDEPPEPPEPSKRVYELNPQSDARHTNGTPRVQAFAETGTAPVRISLFACNSFSESNGELVFTPAGGIAQRGTPAGSISKVEGVPQTGSPQQADPTSAAGGSLDFEITGSDGCAAPIGFRDIDGDGGLDVDTSGVPTEPYGGGSKTAWEPQGVQFQNAGRCDPLDPAICLQPFPNDHFTVTDGATDTGKRVSLNTQSMPANTAGTRIEATEWNRNDGFSPGQAIVTKVPGLDTPAAFAQTDPVPITDLERYLEPDAPIVVIDAATGERHIIWAELDANPDDPADVNLIIRAGSNFEEGHRYVVALRDLRRADGSVIEAQRPFELYRDRVITSDAAIEARRADFEENFDELEDAGIPRDDLYLAWDFTVASERNLSERALSIRDRAFAQLGDTNLADLQVQGTTPSVQITGVTNYEPCGNDGCQGGSPVFSALPLPIGPGDLPLVGGVIGPTQDQLSTVLGNPPENDRIIRKVEGQVVVPCYTDQPGCQTGSKFAYSGATDTIPDQLPGNATLANFTCTIPRSAVEGPNAGPVKPSLYGHGLLGSAGEVEGGNVSAMANDHGFMFCATDWAGFATQDIPTILTILRDLNNFPKLTDRSQQGFLNFMFLGRAMIHAQGFASSPAFRFNGQSIINRDRLFYDGNSQGGILGGGLAALAPDFDRAVLGVVGMNYSTLLRRSVDFTPYAEGQFLDGTPDTGLGLYDNYPNELERPLILGLMQMLWDRGELNGYAHHSTTDPLANTPAHELLMHVAFGDHQVSMWTADVAARTMGASTNPTPLDAGRHPDESPLFGIPRIGDFTQPFGGSALIYWDSGTPAPPISNTPPAGDAFGADPHSHPRNDPKARAQKAAFLSIGGKVVDTCSGSPCYANGYTGVPAP